jgi:aminocarboxymuconate-semialdehyde decarboxylase
MMIKHAPSHYLKRMYFDTVSYHAPAVMCAIQTVGADRLVFGSDAPPLLPMLPKAKKLIEDLPIGAAEKEAILGKNALKLLKRS